MMLYTASDLFPPQTAPYRLQKIDHLVAPKFLVEVHVNRVYIGYLEKMKTNLRTDHMQAPLELKKDFQWGIKR